LGQSLEFAEHTGFWCNALPKNDRTENTGLLLKQARNFDLMKASDTATLWALLIGNFVIGVGVLMPAGLLNELSAAFMQDAATTGTLIGYGAAVLCIEAPLLAFFTNKVDRRTLLVGALVVYAVGHFASAFASNFSMLLTARVIMIGGAAAFTPQAASAIGLIVAPERRATAVAFIFLGWSLASALGVPLASLIGAYTSWSSAYFIMAVACSIAAIGVFLTLPAKLHAPRLSLAMWSNVLSNSKIGLILCVTMIFVAGQFTLYPYIAVSLKTRFDAVPKVISLLFAIYGIAGVVGSVISTKVIGRFGAAKTVSMHLAIVLIGLLLWSGSGSLLPIAVAGLLLWGYGGGPSISGQQARLIGADPDAASASVALNTSVLYAGQASGTYIGGALLSGNFTQWTGVVACTLLVVALFLSLMVRRWLHS
jgi:predicted MFS family arabinose efflux permease